jgi:hypothetical protein
MLGVPNIRIDVHQSLAVGAQSLGIIPALCFNVLKAELWRIGNYFAFVFTRAWPLDFAVLVIILVVLVLLYLHPGAMPAKVKRWALSDVGVLFSNTYRKSLSLIDKRVLFVLIFLLCAQYFLGIRQLIVAQGVRDLIFMDRDHVLDKDDIRQVNRLYPYVTSVELLTAQILSGRGIGNLNTYFFTRLAVFIASALALWWLWSIRLITLRSSKIISRESVRVQGLLLMNALLLVTQILFLCTNFGTLILPNTFPKAVIHFEESEPREASFAISDTVLLMCDVADGLFIYSKRDRSGRFIPRPLLRSYVFLGREELFPPRKRRPPEQGGGSTSWRQFKDGDLTKVLEEPF